MTYLLLDVLCAAERISQTKGAHFGPGFAARSETLEIAMI